MGLAIGGTKVAAGVVDADGRVLNRLPLDTCGARILGFGP
jgi:hypothetical protein